MEFIREVPYIILELDVMGEVQGLESTPKKVLDND